MHFDNTVKLVIYGPFIKGFFVLIGNIFRSRDYHSITWWNGNLASAERCPAPLRFRLRQVSLYSYLDLTWETNLCHGGFSNWPGPRLESDYASDGEFVTYNSVIILFAHWMFNFVMRRYLSNFNPSRKWDRKIVEQVLCPFCLHLCIGLNLRKLVRHEVGMKILLCQA
jgi:hypothetical protein